MNEVTANEIGMQELTVDEIDEVSGGILCLLLIPFAVGYGIGTLIYNAATK